MPRKAKIVYYTGLFFLFTSGGIFFYKIVILWEQALSIQLIVLNFWFQSLLYAIGKLLIAWCAESDILWKEDKDNLGPGLQSKIDELRKNKVSE